MDLILDTSVIIEIFGGNERILELLRKYGNKVFGIASITEFEHLREWCDDHLWAPGCYHGSVGQGWEVVEKYISTQNCTAGQEDL